MGRKFLTRERRRLRGIVFGVGIGIDEVCKR
jgi:hypothetical protein